jgi:hypothetical protein
MSIRRYVPRDIYIRTGDGQHTSAIRSVVAEFSTQGPKFNNRQAHHAPYNNKMARNVEETQNARETRAPRFPHHDRVI